MAVSLARIEKASKLKQTSKVTTYPSDLSEIEFELEPDRAYLANGILSLSRGNKTILLYPEKGEYTLIDTSTGKWEKSKYGETIIIDTGATDELFPKWSKEDLRLDDLNEEPSFMRGLGGLLRCRYYRTHDTNIPFNLGIFKKYEEEEKKGISLDINRLVFFDSSASINIIDILDLYVDKYNRIVQETRRGDFIRINRRAKEIFRPKLKRGLFRRTSVLSYPKLKFEDLVETFDSRRISPKDMDKRDTRYQKIKDFNEELRSLRPEFISSKDDDTPYILLGNNWQDILENNGFKTDINLKSRKYTIKRV